MLIIIIYCSRTLRYERTQISETEPRDKNGTSHLRVVFEKTGCEMGEPEAPAPRGAADVYFLLVAASNLVTALVPSETACFHPAPHPARRPQRRGAQQAPGLRRHRRRRRPAEHPREPSPQEVAVEEVDLFSVVRAPLLTLPGFSRNHPHTRSPVCFLEPRWSLKLMYARAGLALHWTRVSRTSSFSTTPFFFSYPLV